MIGRKLVITAAAFVLMVSAVTLTRNGAPEQTRSWASDQDSLHGKVVSQYGPVANARVRVAGDETFVVTDKEGRFSLPTVPRSARQVWVTAGKEGWFNNGQVSDPTGRVRDIFLNPLYLNDHPDYRFISPVVCSRCHTNLTRYWDRSKMAHTTSNPKLLDMYYGTDAHSRHGISPGYKLDNPQSNGNCATCHAPSAAASSPWSLDLGTILRSSWREWDGVSCEYCHKVRRVIPDKTKPSGYGALLERQSSPTSNAILVFGPYDDVAVPPMAASYNPLFGQGEFCSTCHSHIERREGGKPWDYRKIYTDQEWAGFDLKDATSVPIQTTYQEWKQWQDQLPPGDTNKGKKCQDCHMNWRKTMLPYDNYVVDGMARSSWGTYRSPKDIHPHTLEGGTETQLSTALSMELDGKINGNLLDLTVYITNTNGGHWVPTGETMRSVMLLVQAFDSKHKPLKMTKGERLPDWTGKGKSEYGDYAGMPGAAFARVLGDDKGNVQVPFWRATKVVSDTRIKPKGTTTLEFQFLLDHPEDEPTAEAKLIYRPVVKAWAVEKKWPVQDIIIATKDW